MTPTPQELLAMCDIVLDRGGYDCHSEHACYIARALKSRLAAEAVTHDALIEFIRTWMWENFGSQWGKDRVTAFASAIMAILPGEDTPEIPDSWPVSAGPGGCNPWFIDAAKFVALLNGHPSVWLSYSDAKYIDLRIDTRDCGFVFKGRDGGPLDMPRLLQAMRDRPFVGAYRKSPP